MLLTLVAVVLLGHGCVRVGFDVPGDGGGASADVARTDGSGDGSVDGQADGPLDGPKGDGPDANGPVVDGPLKLDGPNPEQQVGDAGVVPGTWVTIAMGTFTMGSPTSEPCRSSEEQQHQVKLTHDFEMQSTEVTQGQFLDVMGYNPSSFKICGVFCPVEQVNWHESAAYCNALSQKAGKTSCYTCTGSGASVTCQEATAYGGQEVYTCPGYRLPTEAEWEYAYRAGTTTAFYSGTNDAAKCSTCSSTDVNADRIGWYCANSNDTTLAAGQKQPNAWGLYDMAGNVNEWCHDWYQGNIGSEPATDPWGSATGSFRVLRGGSWGSRPFVLRAASRSMGTPTLRIHTLGFRCCRTQ